MTIRGCLSPLSPPLATPLITVWDSGHSEWVDPYPPMFTICRVPAAVGYQKYLIVACGFPNMSDVDVLDSSSGRWYSAQPVPVAGLIMSSVVIDDCCYLSSYGMWEDEKEHILGPTPHSDIQCYISSLYH